MDSNTVCALAWCSPMSYQLYDAELPVMILMLFLSCCLNGLKDFDLMVVYYEQIQLYAVR